MQNHEYFVSDTNIKSLSYQDKMLCNRLVNKAQLLQVLKSMKNGKSPGTDGFTSEFYKFFWVDIGNEVLKSLNEAFYTGELSTTQKQGIITLLSKNNKPREFIQNWRPIILSNVECKLLARVLAA